MQIDKSTFLIVVTTMAASAAGGWFARDKLMLRSEAERAKAPEPEPPPPVSSPAPSDKPPADAAPAAPPCDDSEGEAPVCPAFPDPGDEGGCGRLAARRCADYRDNLKPKPARAAVECLKKLPPGLLCDPIALNKCGHEALMSACPPEASTGSELDDSCKTILESCKSSIPGPTLADCRQTLSGLNEAGRKKMLACAAKDCAAKGLYGCEAR